MAEFMKMYKHLSLTKYLLLDLAAIPTEPAQMSCKIKLGCLFDNQNAYM